MRKFWVIYYKHKDVTRMGIAWGSVCEILLGMVDYEITFILDISEQEFEDARDVLDIDDLTEQISKEIGHLL